MAYDGKLKLQDEVMKSLISKLTNNTRFGELAWREIRPNNNIIVQQHMSMISEFFVRFKCYIYGSIYMANYDRGYLYLFFVGDPLLHHPKNDDEAQNIKGFHWFPSENPLRGQYRLCIQAERDSLIYELHSDGSNDYQSNVFALYKLVKLQGNSENEMNFINSIIQG